MEVIQAIMDRHSVRRYLDKPIEAEIREKLDIYVAEINRISGLHIQVHYDDPKGFDSRLAHYGSFRNVSNYIILAGKNCKDFDERIGYYGELVVLQAQLLGLNTCWAALTYNRRMVKKMIPAGEKFSMVVSLGYGETQGVPHKGKNYLDVVEIAADEMPDWFEDGVEAALLAPTAMNQQKFRARLKANGTPVLEPTGRGSLVRVDLGIAKCHFEVVSGHKVFDRPEEVE